VSQMAALVMRSERAVIVAISETAAPSRKSIPIHAQGTKLRLQGTKLRLSDIPYFDHWKRFCFVLREIASGENGRALPSFEAQKRAQAVLTECGYTWPAAPEAPPCSRQVRLMREGTGDRSLSRNLRERVKLGYQVALPV
jgi:hypothetical protein